MQINLETGEEISGFRTPFGEEHAWGWLAVDSDDKTIYGASAGGIWATEMESGQGEIRWQIGGRRLWGDVYERT